jgi:hypothetical protein
MHSCDACISSPGFLGQCWPETCVVKGTVPNGVGWLQCKQQFDCSMGEIYKITKDFATNNGSMTGFDGVLVLVNECIFRGPKFDPYLFMYGNPSVDGRLLFAYLHRRPTDRWIRCILQQKPWDFQSDQITQPEFCGFFLVSIWFLISYSYPIKLYYHLTSCQIKSNVAISCGIVLNIPSYIVSSHLPIYIFFCTIIIW